MAVRLSVVMVHSPPVSALQVAEDEPSNRATAQQMAEAVVGELIGLNGIDVTLVGPIAQLAPASTDRLTLESLTGDVAVLAWQCPSETMAALAGIDFQGERSPHAHDRDVALPAARIRRIYAFDLNEFAQAGDVIEALIELKNSRRVRTFNLELATGTAARADPGAHRESAAPTPMEPAAPERSDAASASRESLDLDVLLDQLDQLDP